MTCKVQSFQINGYANHYVDTEITRCRVLYSESIAGSGVARLISWLGTAGLVDCFNKSMFDCYIKVYQSFLAGYSQFLVGPTLSYTPESETRHSTIIFKNLEIYLCDHARQLEYSKQYSMIENYYRFVFTIAHYPFPLTKGNLLKVVTKNNLR